MSAQHTTIGDFAPFRYGKALPERDRTDGSVPVYSSAGKTGNHARAIVNGPGVVIGRKGTVGSVHLSTEPFWPIDTAYYIEDAPHRDLRYTYYLLQSQKLSRLNADSAVPGLNRDAAHAVPICVPSLGKQQQIGALLGALDDKITLNNAINETLEATARALFRDWFVDFGPVRAKMEGREPYLAPDVWALFPDRLNEEEKPEGWSVKELDRLATFLNGLALQKYPSTGGDDLPVIKIAELRKGISPNTARASMDVPPAFIVEDGDVLFSWSGTLTQAVWAGGRGALNQHLFKVTSSICPKWLHYFWVDHHLPTFQAIASYKATTMGHIQRHHLSEALCHIADDALMVAADKIIGPLFQRHIDNLIESRSLAIMRDLILPRLLSGELRVTDAVKIAEAA